MRVDAEERGTSCRRPAPLGSTPYSCSSAAILRFSLLPIAERAVLLRAGCSTFHRRSDIAEGQDAHHTRLLLALDVSLAAACRSRGIAACNGMDDDESCEVGTLTRELPVWQSRLPPRLRSRATAHLSSA